MDKTRIRRLNTCTHWFFAYDGSLHSLDLGDVIVVSSKLPFLNTLVDPNQQISWDILSIINT